MDCPNFYARSLARHCTMLLCTALSHTSLVILAFCCGCSYSLAPKGGGEKAHHTHDTHATPLRFCRRAYECSQPLPSTRSPLPTRAPSPPPPSPGKQACRKTRETGMARTRGEVGGGVGGTVLQREGCFTIGKGVMSPPTYRETREHVHDYRTEDFRASEISETWEDIGGFPKRRKFRYYFRCIENFGTASDAIVIFDSISSTAPYRHTCSSGVGPHRPLRRRVSCHSFPSRCASKAFWRCFGRSTSVRSTVVIGRVTSRTSPVLLSVLLIVTSCSWKMWGGAGSGRVGWDAGGRDAT